MKSYESVIDYLFSIPFSQGLKPDLSRAKALNDALNFPSRSYPTIHVAGSNGKGSVALKVAKVLELSGYKVGLYTSPHLVSFRDRIVVNSLPISEEAVVEGVNKLLALQSQLTFFELTTFLAFIYFKHSHVDVAVIETGIGGRFDCTNVIDPILSIITSISREHAAILGEDLEAIAFQKAGIIKPNTPVVLGPKARYQSIYDSAKALNSPLFYPKKISYFFDEENSATAKLSISQIQSQFPVTAEALENGLSLRPPCRFERLQNVIFDVAHNPEAIFSLLQALHIFFPQRKLRFLVGFCKDKDYPSCLELIADVATHIHLVKADSSRAVPSEELQLALYQENPQFSTAHAALEEGINRAYAEATSKGELLVICGSFYIMDPAKQRILELSTVKQA